MVPVIDNKKREKTMILYSKDNRIHRYIERRRMELLVYVCEQNWQSMCCYQDKFSKNLQDIYILIYPMVDEK